MAIVNLRPSYGSLQETTQSSQLGVIPEGEADDHRPCMAKLRFPEADSARC